VNLHSPQFENGLRRKVRELVRSSPRLQHEALAANRRPKHYSAMLLLRPGVSLGFAVLVWQMADRTGHATSALALVSLWAFFSIFIHAQRLIDCLHRADDIPALMVLPVPETLIFQWELQKFLRGALWSLLDLLGGCAAVAIWSRMSPLAGVAIVIVAMIAWIQVLALAMLCLTHFPRWPYQLASGAVVVLLFVVFAGRSLIGNALIAVIDSGASVLNLLLPTGGPLSVSQVLLPNGSWLFLGLLAPTLATVWTLKHSLARLQTGYAFSEPVFPEAPDLRPEPEEEAEFKEPANPSRLPRFGPTAIEEMIQTRQFLVPPAWRHRGWFESLFWSWLDARQRVLVEFVFPEGLSISAPWKKIFRNLAVTCLAAVTAKLLSPNTAVWIAGMGLFVAGCQVLSLILATGRAFQPAQCGGVNIPLYAGYAVGFRELARLLAKLSAVQVPPLLPFAAFSSMLMFYLLNLPLTEGALFGLKLGGLVLASRYVFLALSFSSGTNDTLRFRFWSVFLIFFVVVCGLGFVALSVASFLVPKQSVALALYGTAGLVAYLFFRGYGWFYHRNRFDLMSVPKS